MPPSSPQTSDLQYPRSKNARRATMWCQMCCERHINHMTQQTTTAYGAMIYNWCCKTNTFTEKTNICETNWQRTSSATRIWLPSLPLNEQLEEMHRQQASNVFASIVLNALLLDMLSVIVLAHQKLVGGACVCVRAKNRNNTSWKQMHTIRHRTRVVEADWEMIYKCKHQLAFAGRTRSRPAYIILHG